MGYGVLLSDFVQRQNGLYDHHLFGVYRAQVGWQQVATTGSDQRSHGAVAPVSSRGSKGGNFSWTRAKKGGKINATVF